MYRLSGRRYLVMSWGYNVAGCVSGSHPIGAVGSLTFGVEGKNDSIHAVLHRLERTQGAHEVIAETARS